MQHVTAPYGVPIDHGYNWFGQGTDLFVHIQYIEAWHSILPYISPFTFHILISPRTKGFIPDSCKYYNPYIGAIRTDPKREDQFVYRLWPKRIVHFGPIESDFCYFVTLLKKNVVVLLYGFPNSLTHFDNFNRSKYCFNTWSF